MGTAMVNPEIPLQAQAPRPTDALESYGRVLALKQAIQGQQLQQQQIQASQLENQERQTRLDQMHALNQAYSSSINPDGSVDTDKLLGAVTKSGHAELAPQIITGQANLQKTLSEAGKARLETANLQADAAGSFGKQLQTGSYDPQLFLHGAQLAIKNKAVDPQTLAGPIQAVQKSLLADPSGEQAKQIVKQFSDQSIASSEKWTALQSQQKTAEAAQTRAESSKREADINEKKLPGGLALQGLQELEAQQKTTGQVPMTPKDRAELAIQGQRTSIEDRRATATTSLAESALGDREVNQFAKPHQTNVTQGQGQLEKINEAQQMLRTGNAETQALAVPKVLSALVSGQGSGVRITRPELNAIAKARGLGGDFTAALTKIGNGKSLTETQANQLQGALADVQDRIQKKVEISNAAIDQIQNAPDRATRIQADQQARQKLNELGEAKARYMIGNQAFDIPKSKVGAFLKDNPQAKPQ